MKVFIIAQNKLNDVLCMSFQEQQGCLQTLSCVLFFLHTKKVELFLSQLMSMFIIVITF